jgi:hypothetical protein
MKAVIAAVMILAACGHASPTPVKPIANVAPVDAAVAAADLDAGEDAGDDESCSSNDDQPMRAGGADGEVSLVGCEPANGDDPDVHGRGTAHEDLVFERDSQRITVTVNEWAYPDYDGERASGGLIGVIGAPGRDQAALFELTSSSYDGNGDTSDTRAVLQVFAVQDGAWVKVTELSGGKIHVDVARDGSATVDIDGDSSTLRWDGTSITP